jgi:signal transduction histidine kinase
MAAQWMERSGTTGPKQAKVVSEIIRTAGRATRILNDLLDLTRSSFGTEIPITKTKIGIAALCEEIVDELRAINADRRFKVALEGDPVGLWDPARMGQVLSNLMGNAIQYGDVSSPITAMIAGNDPETVIPTVHNLGPAIPPETQKRIFQSWMRGHEVKDASAHSTNLGLGLYIARLIVEAHGGEISVVLDRTSRNDLLPSASSQLTPVLQLSSNSAVYGPGGLEAQCTVVPGPVDGFGHTDATTKPSSRKRLWTHRRG